MLGGARDLQCQGHSKTGCFCRLTGKLLTRAPESWCFILTATSSDIRGGGDRSIADQAAPQGVNRGLALPCGRRVCALDPFLSALLTPELRTCMFSDSQAIVVHSISGGDR